jgi:nitrogen fixation/metabolism regulation signal transduction histidine kinase
MVAQRNIPEQNDSDKELNSFKQKAEILGLMHDAATNGICLIEISQNHFKTYSDEIYAEKIVMGNDQLVSLIEPNSSFGYILNRASLSFEDFYTQIVEPMLREIEVTWPRSEIYKLENGEYLEVVIDQLTKPGFFRLRVTDVTRRELMAQEIEFRRGYLESIIEAISTTDSIFLVNTDWTVQNVSATEEANPIKLEPGMNLQKLNIPYFTKQDNDTAEEFALRLNAINHVLETGKSLTVPLNYEREDPTTSEKKQVSRLITFCPLRTSMLDNYLPDPQVVVMVKDITNHMNANARVKELENLIDNAKNLKEFMGATVHNILNPVSIIDLSIQMLIRNLEHISKESLLERLQKMQGAVKKITLIRDEVLDTLTKGTKLERYEPEELDIVQLLSSMTTSYSESLMRKIEFQADVDDYRISADPYHISIIVENLISNACKYSQGNITVLLNKTNGKTTIEFIDEGIGIPPEEIQKLLTSSDFFRASNVVGKIAGTGLGMGLIRKSIEKHGGQLKIDSELGVGSRFVVELGG